MTAQPDAAHTLAPIRRLIAIVSALVLLLGYLTVAAIPAATAQETTGSIDANGDKWKTHDLTAPETGTVSVSLDWAVDSANLNLFVRRVDSADPSGPGELVTRSLSAAKPEQVSFDAQQGEEYRLIVGAESGATDYTLVTNQTTSPRREFLGTVDTAGQVAREHDFTLAEGGLVAASLDWQGDAEVDLYLRDDAGKVVTNSLLDSNPKLLTVELPAGDYTWLTKAKSGAAAYTLISEERDGGPIAEGEEHVYTAQAGHTRPSGSVKRTQTHDISVAEAGEVTLVVEALNNGGQPDVFARPINADGSLAKAVTGSGADLPSQQASFQAEPGVTYRVVVRADDGPTDYDMRASLDTTPLRQINGTVDAASQNGRVYSLQVAEPGLVSADLSWESDADLSLFVSAPSGQLVAFARTNANPERLTFEATEAGDYRLQVSARSGAADYLLATTVQTDVARTYSGNVGYEPDPGAGRRSNWTSHDYVATETGYVTLQLTAESTADLGIYVREITDPAKPNSGSLLTSSRTSVTPEQASFQVSKGSTYRLYVSTEETGGSPYTLQADLQTDPLAQALIGTADAAGEAFRQYGFTATSPGELRAELGWDAQAELSLYLQDSEGTVLAQADAGTSPAVVTYSVPEAGDYRLVVGANSGATGFTLDTTFVPSDEPPTAMCSPISTLSCPEVLLGTPVDLALDGTDGGLVDKDGEDIGFTMVDPPSARLAADGDPSNPDVPGYEPSKLDVTADGLTITATQGIQYADNVQSRNTNSLINGLGVGVDATQGVTTLTTTITAPDFDTTASSEKGGLWFGLDEDNLVNLAVQNQANNNVRAQLQREVGGKVASATDEVNGAAFAEGADVELTLVLDEAAGTATGSYSIVGGPVVPLGEFTLPQSFFDGAVLPDGTTGPASFAGLYATARNEATNPVVLTFADFAVTNEAPTGGGDNTAPEVELTGDRTLFEGQDTQIPVTTSDADGDDVTVTVDGLPTGLSYADGSISGTLAQDTRAASPYTVTVTADDGQATTEATFEVTVIDDVALDINFQSATAPTPSGYLADSGQAYGARGNGLSYGWVEEGGSAPLNMSSNGRDRDRAGIDQLLDTFIHMQYGDIGTVYGGNPNCTSNQCDPGAWEIDLPAGLYEVSVAVGDQPSGTSGYDSLHALNAEAGVAIEGFQATGAQEYLEATAYAGVVGDDPLTISAIGGTNTKINYVRIRSVGTQPLVTAVLPPNRGTDAALDTSISASVSVPGNGVGVDPERDTSLTNEAVKLFEVTEGGDVEVDGNRGSTGGNDTIAISPVDDLKPDTTYRYVIDGVLDEAGNTFERFESVFTTGAAADPDPDPEPGAFDPVEGVDFQKVLLPTASGDANGKFFASLEVHRGYLWATTIGQGMYRYEILPDGTLGAAQDLNLLKGRAAVGLQFDADNPDLAWVTHATANISSESAKVGSKMSVIDFSDVANPVLTDVFVNLPRSKKDHLSNSIAYGPSGDGGDPWLYFLQGSNQAAGDVDSSWGTRGETQLTAALLRFDPQDVLAEVSANGPINVATQEVGGTYDPFADDAPLDIYATGIRNAYDLIWHSNGHIYVPTNGTAGGANSPGVSIGPDGTATMVSNQVKGENGYGDGTDVTNECATRRIDGKPYTGGSVPAAAGHPTQLDYLFDVEKGGYYGHPNPTRCEWVLNDGSSSPQNTGAKYPAGTKADPNYRGVAYNFDFNKSPNGVIEYQSDTFGGKLKGRMMVIRFSGNDDVLTMQTSPDGTVLGAQGGDTISGFDGYVDPLDLTEDTEVNAGNIYVNQYNRGGEPQQLYLLRVPDGSGAGASKIAVDPSKVIMSATLNTEQPTDTEPLTVTNNGSEPVEVTATVGGTDAAQFSVTSPGAIAAGGKGTAEVTFDPTGTTVGTRTATVTLSTPDGVSKTVSLRALGFLGQEGSEEPPLQAVVDTLEYGITTGWSGLADGTGPEAKGDEVLEPLFMRASDAPVTMTPVAAFAPQENLPFGWYAAADGPVTTNQVGSIANGQLQTLIPALGSGGTSFDPGTDSFGLYYFSNTFNRTGYTEDSRNDGGGTHRARIYPLTGDRFLVAFEDAANGDYQDYVFVLDNVVAADAGPTDPPPPPPPAEDGIQVNFQSEAAPVPDGYLRDFGQAYGARSGADQGDGLSYGWVTTDTLQPLSLDGNGRDRNLNPTQRLDTLMHMDLPPVSSGGVDRAGSWELALADGAYQVTVSVGDPAKGSAEESHTINIEGVNAVDAFPNSAAAAGSDDRHQQATVDVEVTDGKLTVDQSGGTNTKINYIDIVPLEGGAGEPVAQVNFQTTSAPTPQGWVPDSGQLFDAGRGYGWVRTEGGATKTSDVRLRASEADPLNSTLVIVDDAQVPAVVDGEWEYTLPNGEYEVEVSVGDPDYVDSSHGVSAEGVSVIDGYTSAAKGDYGTGSAIVEVSDGALTLASTGTNTKLQWVRISSTSGADVVPPQVSIALDGDGADGSYTGPVTVTVTATDRTLEFTEYTVDGGPSTRYTEPFEVTGNGSHVVTATATDGAGNETTKTAEFSIAELGQGDLTLTNPEAAPFDDRIVMSRIQSTVSSPKTKDTGAVVLSNDGTEPIEVSALEIADPGAFELVDAPALPATIAVGADLPVTVKFVGTGSGRNTLFESDLTVRHNGSDGPATDVELGAIWQTQSEGGNEPNVVQIAKAYGIGTTIVGSGQQINNQGRLEAIGDEVLSKTWKRLDTSAPLTVRQLGAFHSCCTNTASFGWHPVGNKGSFTKVITHNGAWAQTLLPRINGSDVNPAFKSFIPSAATFSWRIDPESSDWTLNDSGPDQCKDGSKNCQLGHHLRVWPAEDRDGVAIPGSYYVVMDYAGINYDFNDNVFLVTNAAPAD